MLSLRRDNYFNPTCFNNLCPYSQSWLAAEFDTSVHNKGIDMPGLFFWLRNGQRLQGNVYTRTLPRLVSKEVLAMMTEMARETSLKNEHLRNCDYFAIILSCSHFTMLKKNPANGLV